MAVIEIAKIQVRRGQELQTGIPRLDPGEFGWAEDTENLYIGKRVIEGAVDNENTRILTDNDLTNIFSLVGSSVTNAISYKYREDVAYITHNSRRKLQDRLDDDVSLASFGLVVNNSATDITVLFQNAINDLFFNSAWNSTNRVDTRRVLMIPAGTYSISNNILLPPYTTLVGQGSEITKLVLTSTTTNMFKTVDAEGRIFESNNMQSGVKRAREVSIAGMTLQYSTSNNNQSTPALLSLDNVLNAKVEDVFFKTSVDTNSTTTYGLVSSGIGISMRGTGGGIESGDANLCENIEIVNCNFDSLYIGVAGTGTVVRPIITDSLFNNLNRGITLSATAGLAPTNGVFSLNRFSNIVREGIYTTTSTNRTSHVSENNFFIQVGNGSTLDDFTTTSTNKTPVISFLSKGNKSNSDYFHRRHIANITTATNFYYNPLVTGGTTVDDSATFTSDIRFNTSSTVARIGLNGQDQMITGRYQITNGGLSRKGNLLINLSPDGYSSITDSYDYTEYMHVMATGIRARAVTNNNILSVDTAVYPVFVNSGNLRSNWYITGDKHRGRAGAITGVSSGTGTILNITLDDTPAFVINDITENFSLLKSENTDISFLTSEKNVVTGNYIELICTNSSVSTLTNSVLEFQIDILT